MRPPIPLHPADSHRAPGSDQLRGADQLRGPEQPAAQNAGGDRRLRVAMVGAFAFPHVQGSQVFFAEQARALRDAGSDMRLVSYAAVDAAANPVDDLASIALPKSLSPRSARTGPKLAKPIADTALVAQLVRSYRSAPFDVVFAHNVEAALIAAAARPWTRAPVVYVAHTLMQHELDSYAPAAAGAPLTALGHALDAAAARAADGVLVLCESAREALARLTPSPIACIPPGLSSAAAPDERTQRELCSQFGLQPGCFALYAGNLDGYQELDRLAAAARFLNVPVVVATHDRERSQSLRNRFPELEVAALAEPHAVRALTFAAGALVLTRRRVGGFPIKLLNYMEAARPIVAHADVAECLRHGKTALLPPADEGPEQIANAIATVLAEPALAARLGRGARRHLEAEHRWPGLAARTLAFAEAVIVAHGGDRPLAATSESRRA